MSTEPRRPPVRRTSRATGGEFVSAWLISNDCLIIRPPSQFLVAGHECFMRMEGSERVSRGQSKWQSFINECSHDNLFSCNAQKNNIIFKCLTQPLFLKIKAMSCLERKQESGRLLLCFVWCRWRGGINEPAEHETQLSRMRVGPFECHAQIRT